MYELGLDNLEFNKDRDKENITSRNGVTYEITTLKQIIYLDIIGIWVKLQLI